MIVVVSYTHKNVGFSALTMNVEARSKHHVNGVGPPVGSVVSNQRRGHKANTRWKSAPVARGRAGSGRGRASPPPLQNDTEKENRDSQLARITVSFSRKPEYPSIGKQYQAREAPP